MKKYTDEERFTLADKLDSIHTWLYGVPDITPEAEEILHAALDEAIALIYPGYFEKVGKELEEGMNDPALDELVEEARQNPQVQDFIDDINRVKRGEMTRAELEQKIRETRGEEEDIY